MQIAPLCTCNTQLRQNHTTVHAVTPIIIMAGDFTISGAYVVLCLRESSIIKIQKRLEIVLRNPSKTEYQFISHTVNGEKIHMN